MQYRILDHKDAVQFKTLWLFGLQESPFSFSDSYEDEIRKNLPEYEHELTIKGIPVEYFVLGAFLDSKELAGFVQFERDTRSKARHKAFIHRFYIHPTYRSMGYGKQMIAEIIRLASCLEGLEQIHLWVLVSQTSIIPFYEKCGFVCQGSVVKKDLKIGKAYVDAVYMVRYLKQ